MYPSSMYRQFRNFGTLVKRNIDISILGYNKGKVFKETVDDGPGGYISVIPVVSLEFYMQTLHGIPNGAVKAYESNRIYRHYIAITQYKTRQYS